MTKEVKKMHWRTIDKAVAETADHCAASSDVSNAFLERYREDKQFAKKVRVKVQLALNVKPKDRSEEEIMSHIIYSEILSFRIEFQKLMQYSKYAQFAEKQGFEPVAEEEFFKVIEPMQTGTSHWRPQSRRHASPPTRAGILSRRERFHKECRSISMNWEHIFEQGFDKFDEKKGVRVHNTYYHNIKDFFARKKYRNAKPQWEGGNPRRKSSRYATRSHRPYKAPKKSTPKLQGITPEGHLKYYRVHFEKDPKTGEEERRFELFTDSETIEFERVNEEK